MSGKNHNTDNHEKKTILSIEERITNLESKMNLMLSKIQTIMDHFKFKDYSGIMMIN